MLFLRVAACCCAMTVSASAASFGKTDQFLRTNRISSNTGDAPSSSSLSEDQLRDCTFEIVMLDTRDLSDEPSVFGTLVPNQYVSLTAVLNYAYAKTFGYEFSFVHVDKAKLLQNFSAPWHRVFYFADRLAREAPTQEKCKWYLHVDSDAFIRPGSRSVDWQSLPRFISDLASRYDIADNVGAIFSQEQTLLPVMPWTYHAVNAGVYLFRVNDRSEHLFKEWSAAAKDDPALQAKWPAEQGVLTELRFPGRYPTSLSSDHHARLRKHDSIASDLALVNMTEMNSPWGHFVEHLWSGPGSELRAHAFTDALQQLGDADGDKFQSLLKEVRGHVVDWAPSSPK